MKQANRSWISKLKGAAASTRDTLGSFSLGFVPAFGGSAAAATVYVVGAGIATALGAPAIVAVASGLVSVAAVTGPVAIGAVVGGFTAFAGMVKALQKAGIDDIKPPAVALGAVTGIVAAFTLAHNLATGDAREKAQTHSRDATAPQHKVVRHSAPQAPASLVPVFALSVPTQAGVAPDHNKVGAARTYPALMAS